MRPVVYVGGPFRSRSDPYSQWEQEQNIRRAETLALEVWQHGAAAIFPHGSTRYFQGALPDDVWLDGDLAILAKCDAVIFTPDWHRSQGAQAERTFAEVRGIPILDSLADLRRWMQARAEQDRASVVY